jgi:hypothetical protein
MGLHGDPSIERCTAKYDNFVVEFRWADICVKASLDLTRGQRREKHFVCES